MQANVVRRSLSTLILSHPKCIQHRIPNHPEQPERLRRIMQNLEELRAKHRESLLYEEAKPANYEHIELFHEKRYVSAMKRTFASLEKIHKSSSDAGSVYARIDEDTGVMEASGDAALLAAGSVIQAIDRVLDPRNGVKNSFCAVRPPGHHAPPETGMGFCVFNNVGIGANYVRQQYGFKRVAVVDFDVHHGNGTQDGFWNDAGVLFISSHELGNFPKDQGSDTETGAYNNIINLPLRPRDGSAEFRAAYEARAFPRLREFKPEMIFISAGFDAHANDPLGTICLLEDDYHWVTTEVMKIADEVCDGRVVSVLEGGYNVDALTTSVEAHVLALLRQPFGQSTMFRSGGAAAPKAAAAGSR